jgi:hypothetical protein
MAAKKEPKLHEVLAVEADLEGAAKRVLEEAKVTFLKKVEHFMGHHKTLRMFSEARATEEEAAQEHKEPVTTVDAKLRYVHKPVIRWFDALAQKERTNQEARADLVVDGEVLAEDVPATLLLGLESRLKLLRGVYEAIPTQPPSMVWVEDPGSGKGVYRSKYPEKRDKTEKDVAYKIIVPATKEHPAQAQTWSENVKVGVLTTERWTTTITPGEKSNLLERIDKLLYATKRARQRANSTTLVKVQIGKKLLDFIHQDA